MRNFTPYIHIEEGGGEFFLMHYLNDADIINAIKPVICTYRQSSTKAVRRVLVRKRRELAIWRCGPSHCKRAVHLYLRLRYHQDLMEEQPARVII